MFLALFFASQLISNKNSHKIAAIGYSNMQYIQHDDYGRCKNSAIASLELFSHGIPSSTNSANSFRFLNLMHNKIVLLLLTNWHQFHNSAQVCEIWTIWEMILKNFWTQCKLQFHEVPQTRVISQADEPKRATCQHEMITHLRIEQIKELSSPQRPPFLIWLIITGIPDILLSRGISHFIGHAYASCMYIFDSPGGIFRKGMDAETPIAAATVDKKPARSDSQSEVVITAVSNLNMFKMMSFQKFHHATRHWKKIVKKIIYLKWQRKQWWNSKGRANKIGKISWKLIKTNTKHIF